MRELISLSQEEFIYPINRRRLLRVDHPDVLLLASVVFVTKLFHPLHNTTSFSVGPESTTGLRMDWEKWQAIYSEPVEDGFDRRDIDKLGSNDAWNMTGRQIDEYLAWYQQTRLRDKEGRRPSRLSPNSWI